jgi:hypothetical protein
MERDAAGGTVRRVRRCLLSPRVQRRAADGESLVETLDITRLSKSQVSEMAKDLDAHVEAFLVRPLEAMLDALNELAQQITLAWRR